MCRYSMGIPQAKIDSVTDQDILTHLKTHINEVVAVPVDVKAAVQKHQVRSL